MKAQNCQCLCIIKNVIISIFGLIIFFKNIFFFNSYNDFPAVIPNTPVLRGKPIELFPIEELIVMEDQRVPVERMSKKLSATLLRVDLKF